MQTLRRAVFLGLLALGAAAQASRAQGLTCEQDCSSESCAQADCAPATGGGFCECGGGALPWGDDVFLAYCRAWGAPAAGCGRATPAADPTVTSAAAPAPLANAAAMEKALAGQNPCVAGLLQAMRDGDGWASGTVHGLIHDAHYDPSSGVAHGEALAFVGQATATGPSTAQIDITLAGDASQLGWIQQFSATAAPAAVPPQSIHGSVTGGGQHGSLAVTALGGKTQTVAW